MACEEEDCGVYGSGWGGGDFHERLDWLVDDRCRKWAIKQREDGSNGERNES